MRTAETDDYGCDCARHAMNWLTVSTAQRLRLLASNHMFHRIRHMLELIRFSHTLFALPFALLAAAMAWSENRHGSPPVAWRWTDLLGILLCMATARSAAMAFNRLADERIDAENPRTSGRHLPAGLLSRTSVVLFAVACSAAFVAATLLFLPNRLPLYLSLPVLAFLLAYSFTKRFTALSHFWLGAALMLAPVSAWIAIRGEFVERNIADLAAGRRARRGGAALGRRFRHDLRLSGRGLRSSARA